MSDDKVGAVCTGGCGAWLPSEPWCCPGCTIRQLKAELEKTEHLYKLAIQYGNQKRRACENLELEAQEAIRCAATWRGQAEKAEKALSNEVQTTRSWLARADPARTRIEVLEAALTKACAGIEQVIFLIYRLHDDVIDDVEAIKKQVPGWQKLAQSIKTPHESVPPDIVLYTWMEPKPIDEIHTAVLDRLKTFKLWPDIPIKIMVIEGHPVFVTEAPYMWAPPAV
jgi:hypothetical protein